MKLKELKRQKKLQLKNKKQKMKSKKKIMIDSRTTLKAVEKQLNKILKNLIIKKRNIKNLKYLNQSL